MADIPIKADSTTGEQDLSQKTVVVLVILTVLISVFGTVAVLSEAGNIKTEIKTKTTGTTSGKVQLEVINPNDIGKNPAPQTGLATGRVALEILPTKK